MFLADLIHRYFDRILLSYTTNTNIQTAKRVPKLRLLKNQAVETIKSSASALYFA
jgi:hypothetical protein